MYLIHIKIKKRHILVYEKTDRCNIYSSNSKKGIKDNVVI